MTTRTLSRAVSLALTLIAAPILLASEANAQRAQIAGLSRQPSEAAAKVFLDPSDTVLLLLDHQTGLFQTVKDIPIAELRANTVVLAKIAELAKAPILTTASEPGGTNGPLMPELAAAPRSLRRRRPAPCRRPCP